MARYNEILAGRYNRFITKLLSMKGPAPAPQLAGDITISMALFNGAENRYLESWNRFGIMKSFAASAANFNQFRLRNPPTSNMVAVIEKIQVSTSATTDLFDLSVAATNTDLANVLSASVMRFDARGSQSPTAIPTWQQTAATNTLGATVGRVGVGAGLSGDFISTDFQELTLLPGDAWHVNANTVNLGQSICYWWRERFLEDSERT